MVPTRRQAMKGSSILLSMTAQTLGVVHEANGHPMRSSDHVYYAYVVRSFTMYNVEQAQM
jgi:hypothetical protein